MSDEQNDQPKTEGGSGSAAGESVNPVNEVGAPQQGEPSVVLEVPIGIPVSPEEFRRLKGEAEKLAEQAKGEPGQVAPPQTAEGQEDMQSSEGGSR